MNINQTNSPTFSATFRTQNLKLNQKAALDSVVSLLTPSREYKWASERNFDIYFIKPNRKDGVLRAVYFDNKMGTFVRNTNGRILETDARSKNPKSINCLNIAKRIQEKLNEIIGGKYKAPYWYNNPMKYGQELETIVEKQDIIKNSN